MTSRYDDLLTKLSVPHPWSDLNEQAQSSTLLEPYTYITSNPGKEIRTIMIAAFNRWLNVPKPKLDVISRVVNMLHSASLLVDDIEDDSQLRRGNPVAHKVYGIPQTINTANYVYFLAYQALFELRNDVSSKTSEPNSDSPTPPNNRIIPDKDLDKLVTAELLALHRGQGLEIFWRDSLQCPTEDEYVAMVNNKTGGLFRIAIKLMMACATSNVDVDYVPLVNLIGVFFQIRDDYMNLQSTEYSTNKGFAEDLTEGKFSFPIVHAVQTDRTNRQVMNVLQKRPTTPTLKILTINYLRTRTKSFEYTLVVLRSLEAQIRAEISRLGGNEGLEKVVDALSVTS